MTNQAAKRIHSREKPQMTFLQRFRRNFSRGRLIEFVELCFLSIQFVALTGMFSAETSPTRDQWTTPFSRHIP
jgi:hypothetical protein